MTEVKASAAAELTLLPKERPLVAEMKAWIEEKRAEYQAELDKANQ